MIYLTPIGIACIITYTALFKPLKEFLSANEKNPFYGFWSHLINCGYCLGFWCGIFVFLWMNYPIKEVICYGFSSSFLCGLSINFINYLKRH